MKKSYHALKDDELVSIICKHDNESGYAFNEIYQRYSSGVHAYILRVTGSNDATEDIFQDTFIKFYKNVRDDLKESNISGFLITIARNLCLNYKRNKKNNVDINEYEFIHQVSQNQEENELHEIIAMALDLIDIEYREAFVLREYTGLAYNEIALQMNISESNAKTRVFRAKQKLKEILQPYLKELSN